MASPMGLTVMLMIHRALHTEPTGAARSQAELILHHLREFVRSTLRLAAAAAAAICLSASIAAAAAAAAATRCRRARPFAIIASWRPAPEQTTTRARKSQGTPKRCKLAHYVDCKFRLMASRWANVWANPVTFALRLGAAVTRPGGRSAAVTLLPVRS
jgi:hypothetical protein